MLKHTKLLLSVVLIGGMIAFVGCGDDDSGPAAINVVSVTAAGTDFDTGEPVSGIDLFGATSASNVPLDAVITATFSSDIDETTVSNSAVQLTTNGDAVDANISVSGAEVTLTPTNDLERGANYDIAITTAVAAADGGVLSGSASLSFKTAGRGEVTAPQASSQQIYVNLNGNTDDQMGNYPLANSAAVTYYADRFGQPASAAYFDGDQTIIEYEDGVNLLTQNVTLSMWIKVDTLNHFDANGNTAGMFVFGIGNFKGIQLELHQWAQFNRMKFAATYTSDNVDNPIFAEDFTVWDLDGNLEDFEINRGADFENNAAGGLVGLTVGKWAHLVYVYSSSENKRYCYINGTLQRSTDFNTSAIERITQITGMAFNPSETQDEPSDDDYISTRLALGFIHGSDSKNFAAEPWGGYSIATAQHYKGGMDDVRIWNTALTSAEISTLYDAEKP